MHDGDWICPRCLAENNDDPTVSKYTCEMCGGVFDWVEIDWEQSNTGLQADFADTCEYCDTPVNSPNFAYHFCTGRKAAKA